jgi:hypothetical protein
MANGRAVIKALSADGEMVVYSVSRPSKEALNHLDLGRQMPLRAFPNGLYD